MFKKQAYIQSLNVGKTKPEVTDEITVLEKVGDNDYIVDYKGVRCHALLIGSFAHISQTTFTGGLRNEIPILSLQQRRLSRIGIPRRIRQIYRPQLYVLLASGSDKVIPRTVRIKISTHYYSKIILGVFLQWKTTQFWNKSRQTV